MAQLIKTDGTITTIKGDNTDKTFTLNQLQKAVGGYVEKIAFTGKVILVDEDGLMKHLPFNSKASEFVGIKLVGDVLLLDENELN